MTFVFQCREHDQYQRVCYSYFNSKNIINVNGYAIRIQYREHYQYKKGMTFLFQCREHDQYKRVCHSYFNAENIIKYKMV